MDVNSVVVLRMENVLPPYDWNYWKVTQHGMFISAYLPPYDWKWNYWKVTQHGMFISAYLPPYDWNYWKVTQHGYHMELIGKCVMDLDDVTDDF